ncbi:glycoside hydrolase family 2 sugar binding protein [Kribbella flavida DSM 17836]|uniref:Glycoside hydrolase family 2 sugar binding protein n=1 Tax=Kribbella flavida (strain DSM 17836 / JCM 10339 / NBRC 14399) TaxID=479435 RepID=D2PZX3_KRIFD|nr:sugar-binding domain-containing protein [Kribbella flavida]ADB29971.1 glycoside hydrolase family 2 sugar binding protein [Kribbella flavida DSM 17836]
MPSTQPRPEHPRPQFVRPHWLNLNGEWQFESDRSDSGLERGLRDRELAQRITVPFAPESQLSGIEDVDFQEAVWYRTTVTVPAEWTGHDAVLHFQAVDHDATVWVNGVEVVRHRGGFTPFSANLAGVAGPGDEALIVVRARDSRYGVQARGKQSTLYFNRDCHYTRTTGIWQTVWLEAVPAVHLGRPRITPDVAGSAFHLDVPVSANKPGWKVRAVLSDADGEIVTAEVRADLDLAPRLVLAVPTDRVRLWDTTDPHLYGVRLELLDADGAVVDQAASYAGLRSVSINGKAVLINGKHVFQRLVLDQGYWPESLMTAPSEEALVADIELSLAAGFNGARLHQKVFEERFLYHADRMGYLVWGEFGDWGAGVAEGTQRDNQQPTASFVTQWLEAVERDYSHPSIVGWCPLNETHQLLHDRITQLDDVTRAMFLATKAADTSRPVLDASGYSHRVPETDIWDSHNYEQDPVEFGKQMAGLAEGKPYGNTGGADDRPISQPYNGQPYFCSEFGGIWWNPEAAASAAGEDRTESWGYGQRVRDEAEFYERFAGLVDVLLDDPLMFGYCYTQLTDVFQEENGIYRFDRSTKLDVERIRKIQVRAAAYEQD